MNLPDPLSGLPVASTLQLSPDRLAVTLSNGKSFLLEAATAAKAEEIKQLGILLLQLTTDRPCFQTYCGLTVLRNRKFHVFQDAAGESLRTRIENLRGQSYIRWDPLQVESYVQQMAFSVNSLHSNQLIHWKLNPKNFYFDVNNKVKLGGLMHVKTVSVGKFEAARRKELNWLGRCLVAMLLLVDFEALLGWEVDEMLANCRKTNLFRGKTAVIVEGTLQGVWQADYLSVPPTDSQSSLFNSDLPAVLLPPPSFASPISSIRSNSGPSSLGSELRVSEESLGLAPLACSVCQGASTLLTPCKCAFCLACFAGYWERIAGMLTSELGLICQNCNTLLDKEFIFEHIASEKDAVKALDTALVAIQLFLCPFCENQLPYLSDSPATNVTCDHCKKRFCSECRNSPHTLGPCPISKENATLPTAQISPRTSFDHRLLS